MILFEDQDAAETGKDKPLRVQAVADSTPARIKVIGVGGGGGNAVNRMIDAQLRGIEFIAANTDLQALRQVPRADQAADRPACSPRASAPAPIPSMGRKAALEDTDQHPRGRSKGADMVFLTAGLGGGTGTGAVPIIASLAAEIGALTVAVVTKPFGFEGRRRLQYAERGVEELRERGRHADHHPQRAAAQLRRARHAALRGLPHRRRRAAAGRAGHQRPDHHPGRGQRRLRRRAHDHDRHGHGADGHRRRQGRAPGARGGAAGDLLAAARGDLDPGRPRRADQHLRRPRPDAARGRRGGAHHLRTRSIRTPTSSPAW